MIRVYGIKTCDTCRKALKALREAGKTVQFVDVRADGLANDKRALFLAEFGEALINTRSTTWRGMDAASRAQPPLELLAAHPTLMKRPVIDNNGALSLGWTKDVQAGFGL